MMRLRSMLAATAIAGALAMFPMLAQNVTPSFHALFDGTGLELLQSAPFHAQRS